MKIGTLKFTMEIDGKSLQRMADELRTGALLIDAWKAQKKNLKAENRMKAETIERSFVTGRNAFVRKEEE